MKSSKKLFAVLVLAVCCAAKVAAAPNIVVDDLVAVPEGGSATLTVTLDSYPSPVTVTVDEAPGGDDDLTVSPMIFTLSSEHPSQVLTFFAAGDADLIPGGREFTLTGSNASVAMIGAYEVDDDEFDLPGLPVVVGQNIVVDSYVAVDENGTASLSVTLNDYSQDVTIKIEEGSGDRDLTVSPMVFMLSSANRAQELIFSAAEDADGTPGAQTFILVGDDNSVAMVGAYEVDDEGAGLPPNPIAVVVTPGYVFEGKEDNETVRVQLSRDPLEPITLTINKVSGDPDITVKNPPIILDSSNWNGDNNVVRISAVEDDDLVDDTAIFEASGADLSMPFRVTAVDDDIMVTINVFGRGSATNSGIHDIDNDLPELIAFPKVGESFLRWDGPDVEFVDNKSGVLTFLDLRKLQAEVDLADLVGQGDLIRDNITIEAHFSSRTEAFEDEVQSKSGCAVNAGGVINLLPNLLLITGLLIGRAFLRRKEA